MDTDHSLVCAQAEGRDWVLYNGDCIEVLRGLPDSSIDYCIYSPPFSSLYTYSNSDRDLGNSVNYAQFSEHYGFVARELFRVIKPGRLVSFHCMLLPLSKVRDGIIGLRDFRGDLIRVHEKDGFVLHSEVTIWKDPVTAMQRTKAIGLLYKQLRKDSAMSRQGIPDYLVTMRKPGINPRPIDHKPEDFPLDLWQKYASPVWMDINQSDTLQRESAREERDERHIAPLQLEVIRRGLMLWSRQGDTVLSPFAGIGSEGYEAIRAERKFIGIELKGSYYIQAVENLRAAEQLRTGTLFDASA
jgi:DNA modification methylase